RGLKNGASPDWMQRRLKSAGQRPISALVDITNYVMLDLGRPSHAYDVSKLNGGLTARAAEAGENVLALNDKEYALEPFMTVIADDRQVHDIGGIMGGEDSGVSNATTDVMLEGAYFTPERIARTGQPRAQPLRTRRRPGVPRRRSGDPYRAHPRHLRRRGIRADPGWPATGRESDDPVRLWPRKGARRDRRARSAPEG